MSKFAFIKDDIPDLEPQIMVVIVEKFDDCAEGVMTDFRVCPDREAVAAYVSQRLGAYTVTRP